MSCTIRQEVLRSAGPLSPVQTYLKTLHLTFSLNFPTFHYRTPMHATAPADIKANQDKKSGSLSDEFLFVLESAAVIDHVNLEGVGYQ